MPSYRSRVFLFLLRNRHLFRPWKKISRPDWNSRDALLNFRKECEDGAKRFGTIPKGISVVPADIDGMQGEWITPQQGEQGKVILFFHGGGYVSGSCADHRIHVAKFVRGTNLRALLFAYRLAPENTYPAALEDAVKAYRWLLAQGFSSLNIVFAGDSAGGGLCLATLLALKETATPLPAAAVALSPWTDLHCTGGSYRTNAPTCLSPPGTWTAFSRHYIGESDPTQPLISPLYGNLQGLPPLFISVGGSEILLDDSVNFAKKVKEAQGDVTLLIGEGLFHCYPVCAPLFPEATKAMEEICTFIKNRLAGVEVS